jgi:hypothetical protein
LGCGRFLGFRVLDVGFDGDGGRQWGEPI